MKYIKRPLSALLTVCLLLGVLPTEAFASPQGEATAAMAAVASPCGLAKASVGSTPSSRQTVSRAESGRFMYFIVIPPIKAHSERKKMAGGPTPNSPSRRLRHRGRRCRQRSDYLSSLYLLINKDRFFAAAVAPG